MSISSVRPYTPVTYSAPAAPVQAQSVASGPRGGGILGGGGGVSILQVGSWIGGAWGGLRLAKAFGMNPAGFGLAAIFGVGALVGNWVYRRLTGT